MLISLKKSVYSFAVALVFFVNIFAAVSQNKTVKKSPSATVDRAEIELVARGLQSNFSGTLLNPTQNTVTRIAKAQFIATQTPSVFKNDSTLNVILNKSNGTPRYISFNDIKKSLQKNAASGNLVNNSLTLIASNTDLFKIKDPVNELKLSRRSTDTAGRIHLRFSQFLKNIEVWGKEITFHYKQDGSLYSVNAAYIPTPEIQFIEKIDSLTAVTLAIRSLQKQSQFSLISENIKSLLHYQGPEGVKCLWDDPATGKVYLSWRVTIRLNIQENWVVLVNANNGDILCKFNQTPNQGPVSARAYDAIGRQQTIHVYNIDTAFFMIDASRAIWIPNQNNILNAPKGALWTVNYNSLFSGEYFDNFTSNNNTWKDSVAVSAHNNAGIVYQYFFDTFNRRSFDDSGSTIMSVVHWPDVDGKPLDNAFWNGNFVVYGDGVTYRPFAAGLDVVAHEITHGVIQHTVNLDYQFQSGALNESFADIFASMVDRDDYLIGEDIGYTRPLRDMENPESCGQPSHMRNFIHSSILDDNGGVHYNSGIPNNAFFRISNSIGKEKSEQIFYRILSAGYLNRLSEFIDLRFAALQATKDLFKDGNELSVVTNAFDSVGIIPDSVLLLENPLEKGSSWVVALSSQTNKKKLTILSAHPGLIPPRYLSSTSIYAFSSKPYSIARNGELLLFIDQNNNIHSINMKTATESIVSTGGIWSSIALAPDGSLAAATSTFNDSSIYIFNVNNPSKSSVLKLNSQQNHLNNVSIMFADALEWNTKGDLLAFDFYYRNLSNNVSYWNIAFLDIKTGRLSFPLYKQNENIDYCYPSFSRTSDFFMVYEKKDFINNKYNIETINLLSSKVSPVADVTNEYTFPIFSHNDSCILFQQKATSQSNQLWKIPLSNNSTTPATAELFASDYIRPSWLTIENILTVNHPKRHSAPVLHFGKLTKTNNSFYIEYSLSQSMNVACELFDCRGRKVYSSPEKLQCAGVHQMTLSNKENSTLGSGLYFCKLNLTLNHFKESRSLKINLIR